MFMYDILEIQLNLVFNQSFIDHFRGNSSCSQASRMLISVHFDDWLA